MREDLIKLQNTLAMVETRGESTLIMADSMHFLNSIILKLDSKGMAPEMPCAGVEE